MLIFKTLITHFEKKINCVDSVPNLTHKVPHSTEKLCLKFLYGLPNI